MRKLGMARKLMQLRSIQSQTEGASPRKMNAAYRAEARWGRPSSQVGA